PVAERVQSPAYSPSLFNGAGDEREVDRVGNYVFKWNLLWTSPYKDWLIAGIGKTLLIGASAWVIALGVGIVVGMCRHAASRPLRAFGTAYVEIFRNIPLLVQLFLWYYAVPPLFGTAF